MNARNVAFAAAAAVAAGVVYVMVHERRRKVKKEQQRRAEQPIPKEMLIEILQEASVEAARFAEQIGAWVAKMQGEHGLTEENAHVLRQVRCRMRQFGRRRHSAPPAARARRAARAPRATLLAQQRFESKLDEVINGIRQRKGASEKMMDLAFRQHMEDKDVQAALGTIRRQMCAAIAAHAAARRRALPPSDGIAVFAADASARTRRHALLLSRRRRAARPRSRAEVARAARARSRPRRCACRRA